MNNKLFLVLVNVPMIFALLIITNLVYDLAGSNTTIANAASAAMLLISFSFLSLALLTIRQVSRNADISQIDSSKNVKDNSRKIAA